MGGALDDLKNYAAAFSFIISILALIFSYYSWRKSRQSTLYSDIDGRYLELIKIAINNPRFVNPEFTKSYKERFEGNELLQYELYAYAVWNVLETICDRREDKSLFETWLPVIREENWLHRNWLNAEENQHRFKKSFWRFLIANDNIPCPDCEKVQVGSLCTRCGALRVIATAGEEMPLIKRHKLELSNKSSNTGAGKDRSAPGHEVIGNK